MKRKLTAIAALLGLLLTCGVAIADRDTGSPEPPPGESGGLETIPLETESSAAGVMRLAGVEASAQRAAGPFPRAIAIVTVVDGDGNPVPGAKVTGKFSGDVGRRPLVLSGVTGADGSVTLRTPSLGTAQPEFAFEVVDVTHPELTYEKPE